MISQAKERIAAQANETISLEFPFKHHPLHGRVFTPWGPFGTMYAVTTKAQYQKIKGLNTRLYVVFSMAYLVLLILCDAIANAFHLGFLEKSLIEVVGLFLTFVVLNVRNTKEAAHHLSVAEPRQPFLLVLRHLASKQKLGRLWLQSIMFAGLAWVTWVFTQHTSRDKQIAMWMLTGFFALFALLCSLMVVLRDSSPKNRKSGCQMIAQAKAPSKKGDKGDKLIEHIFRQHPVHGLVLAPWGVFGAMYIVETEVEYERLKREFTAASIFSVLGLFVYHVINDIFHLSLIVTFIFLVLLPLIYYAKLTRRITRQLSIAEPRLPLLSALRQYAREQSLWMLWLTSIFFSVCTWFAWLFAHHDYGHQRIAGWFFLFLCAFIALAHSLMIALRGAVAKSKA